MEYTYWENALKGNFLTVHDGEPQPGFYRKRTGKAAGFLPVAIWDDFGKMVSLVNGEPSDPSEIWTYVCQYPVSEEHYRQRVETGRWWDESEAVTSSLAHDPRNSVDDPAAAIKDQIDAAMAGVTDYANINSDETAAKAQSLRSRLLELSREADKTREKLKKPHLDAGRAVDEKWNPMVKAAKAGADTIAQALGAHETVKARAAAKAAAEAEEARQKALREAQEAAQAANPASEPELPMPPEPAPAPAPIPATIRGAYGRAASVKVFKKATVVDIDKALVFLKTHKELVELVNILAQRAVTAGYDVPGVEVTEERRVS